MTNKKELLRETTCIIAHLRPLWEFVSWAAKVSGVMGDRCAKEKPSVSSSKRGKTKVPGGNKSLPKRRIK